MEELVSKLNKECGFLFVGENNQYQCPITKSTLKLLFEGYELESKNVTICFEECDFGVGRFRAFVSGIKVFECKQDELRNIFGD